jgi:hypothetical protein
MNYKIRIAVEAAAFRSMVEHLQRHSATARQVLALPAVIQ